VVALLVVALRVWVLRLPLRGVVPLRGDEQITLMMKRVGSRPGPCPILIFGLYA